MSWYFRRSRKFGLFRITVSKSGLSSSVGLGGLRITNSSRGTYLSASPGGGVYFRERLGGGAPIPRPASVPPANPLQQIASDDVSNMVEHAAILNRLNENERRGAWLPWLGFALALIAVLTLSLPGLAIGAVLIGACWALRNHLTAKYAVELDYRFDEDDSQRYEALRNALGTLARCDRVWQISAFGATTDWKRNAGANQIVQRSGASVGHGTARSFRANVEVPHLIAGKETLYFLPDLILVKQGKHFGAVSYGSLQVAHSATRFNEEQGVPNDTQVVGATWRYVNKNGGPDRRFNNNCQIPIVTYGEIALRSESGLRVALMTSSPKAAETAATGLRLIQSFKPVQMMYLQAGKSTQQ